MAYKIKSLITKTILREADDEPRFKFQKQELGRVPFKTSKISDPHIRDIVNIASKKTGIPTAAIDAKIAEKVNKIEKLKKYSLLLYDTAAKNAVEDAAFDLIHFVVDDPEFQAKRVKLDTEIVEKLARLIEDEYPDWFTHLRAPGETHGITEINPTFVPNDDKNLSKFNFVTTAAATPDGEFIFNREFMQKLLDFAVISNLKPKGKKYKSPNPNTPPLIPPAYGYIEFLILHELLHYAYGDFDSMKRLPNFSHKIHNFASDFRSNHFLVKSGYDQLPIGLFSDHINYDRFDSYAEMAAKVKEEFDKLPKEEQEIFSELSDLDDHQQDSEQTDQKDGQAQGQSKDQKGKWTPKVGDKVRLPDGSPGIVKSVEGGKAQVERLKS